MGIFGALSNPEIKEQLTRLTRKLDQIEAGAAAPRPTTPVRNVRVGAVPEAIMRVLSASVEPMRMRDIHTEVEVLIGQPVSRSSVKNWLASHVRGEHAALVRLARGRYSVAG